MTLKITEQKKHDPQPGERRGDITFATLIQEGMSSNLYLVWHHRYWSAMICKMMRAEERDDVRWRKLLRSEGEILEKLAHPNVVKPFEVNMHAPLPYVLLEYLPGATVRQVLRHKGRFPLQDALALTMHLGGTLVHIHQSGYLHRDIKPSNVMLHSGRVKLFDFGVAWPISDTPPPDKSGTPAYLAPEQCRQEPLTPGVDIWALGIFLFELVTGELPFPDGDYHNYDAPLEVRYPQLVNPPKKLKEMARRVPAGVQEWLDCCLAFKAADRFQKMEDCLVELDQFCKTKIWPARASENGQLPTLTAFLHS